MKKIAIVLLVFSILSNSTVVLGNESVLENVLMSSPGSTHSDWSAIALTVSGVDFDEDVYITGLNEYVQSKYLTKSKLSANKSTEWHRLIIALNLLGYDATNFFGINLLNDGVYFRENLGKQGLNGYIWALIALNSGNFEKVRNGINTEDAILREILSKQNEDGGFSLSDDESSCDITAMVLYALSFYMDDVNVNNTVVRAMNYLQSTQNKDGTFSEKGVPNAESTAQVIIALKAFQNRFYGEFIDLHNALLQFKTADGFSHVAGGETDVMATYQAVCALSAIDKNGPVYSANAMAKNVESETEPATEEETFLKLETVQMEIEIPTEFFAVSQTEVELFNEPINEYTEVKLSVEPTVEVSATTDNIVETIEENIPTEAPTTEINEVGTNNKPLFNMWTIPGIFVAIVIFSVIIIRRRI